MSTYYVDSSALVKRYVTEIGSGWMQTLCNPAAGHILVLAHVGIVEIAAALAAKHRHGVLPAPILDGLLRDLQHDSATQYWLIDIDHTIVNLAFALTRCRKLRGYDAIHLACALFLRNTLLQNNLPLPILLSADDDLLAAAVAEGLTVDNPNMHP